MSTTYTTKAGNLWLWTLGAREDAWVRQRDRHRCFTIETDTAGVETVDVNSPVGPWFRLGEALGLKGGLRLEKCPGRVWRLYEGEALAREFSAKVPVDAADHLAVAQPPLTLIPALADCADDDALEVILAAVEESKALDAVFDYPDLPRPTWVATYNPAAGAIDRIECLVRRQLAHMEGLDHVRCDDAAALRDLTASWANLLSAPKPPKRAAAKGRG